MGSQPTQHKNKSSVVAEMGNRGHDMGQKEEGAAVPILQGSWVPV